MDIIINGKKESLEEMPVQRLLLDRGIDPARVVVELNGEILSPEFFDKRKLASGDNLEIVQFVGGG